MELYTYPARADTQKFYDPESKKSYPVKSHGKKTMILPYALNDLIDKFDLPGDIFEK